MTDLMGRIAELSDEQRELLRQRLQKAKGTGRRAADSKGADSAAADSMAGASVIEASSAAGEPDLSFAQESTWFRDRLSPGNPIHNITGALRLEGDLRQDALQSALDGIVARHQTLRVRFEAPTGQPQQVVEEPFSLPMEALDLRDLPAEEKERRRLQVFQDDLEQGFDLTRDKLIRARLLRLEDRLHVLILTMHHIASDGWSIGIVMAELEELYAAAVESRPAELPPLTIQYGDFARWQRSRLESGMERSLEYWKARLADPPTLTVLSPDRQEHGVEPATFGLGETSFLKLDGPQKEALEELGRRHDATLFMTLLSGFLSLLKRTTGNEDLLIGTPVSGRNRVETEPLVGLFVNTVAVRVSLTPETTFAEALAATRREVLAGLEHQEVPFDRVVRELQQEGVDRRLLDVVFNLTPAPVREAKLPDLTVRVEPPPAMPAEFSMQLYVNEWQGELELKLVYPRERYSQGRMDAFLAQLKSVLDQVVEDPDVALGRLDLVEPSSREVLPDPHEPLAKPPQAPIAKSIFEWVQKTPDQTALSLGQEHMTYGELGAGAAAVARGLLDEGFQKGDVVAVMGPRAPETVVAMVGVFFAGGLLMTLSRELPEARQRAMLEQGKARFVLRTGEARKEDDWVAGVDDLKVVAMAERGETWTSDAGAEPEEPLDDRAYIFFTSGSTGEPKGILGSHAGLAQFLDWQRYTFSITPEDRFAQLTGLSFDVVLRDVFAPLTAGAGLVFLGESLSGAETLRRIEEEEITALHTVPSVIETWLLDVPEGVQPTSLRVMFVAGEPLTADLVDRWRRAFPTAGEMVNLYGPTETTLAKLFYRVPATLTAGVQPLGSPMPHAQALILTDDHRLCGVGEPGHIAVRTGFRSHGYLGAAQKFRHEGRPGGLSTEAKREPMSSGDGETGLFSKSSDDKISTPATSVATRGNRQAEAPGPFLGGAETDSGFVANPFTEDPEDLIYLTGDRGRYRSDGSVEFLGRIDHQIKIRGVRVEPTEIATVLNGHKTVAACAVVARDGADGPMLVAYVVPARGAEMDPEALQDFLRLRLPAALIPQAFVSLDALPLTANQKLDREALPAPSGMRPNLKSRYVAPRDAVELQLVQVWQEMLKVKPVGVRDDFFALGGHSLMALHLLVRIEQRLGVKVPLGPFLQGPNISHLAEVVRRRESTSRTLVPLWTSDQDHKLFVVHPGGGTLLNYVHLVRHLGAHISIFGLQARGLDDQDPPSHDLKEMAADYVEQILEAQPAGPYLLAGHSLGGLIAYEMARQLQDSGREVALVALFDTSLKRPQEEQATDESSRDAASLVEMADVIGRFSGKSLGLSFDQLRSLDADAQLEAFVEALDRADISLFGDSQQARRVLEVSKAHVQAGRSYSPPESSLPITLFRAEAERDADGTDETLGWSDLNEAAQVVWTPGDHVTMMAEPAVEHLARAFGRRLEEVMGPAE